MFLADDEAWSAERQRSAQSRGRLFLTNPLTVWHWLGASALVGGGVLGIAFIVL